MISLSEAVSVSISLIAFFVFGVSTLLIAAELKSISVLSAYIQIKPHDQSESHVCIITYPSGDELTGLTPR